MKKHLYFVPLALTAFLIFLAACSDNEIPLFDGEDNIFYDNEAVNRLNDAIDEYVSVCKENPAACSDQTPGNSGGTSSSHDDNQYNDPSSSSAGGTTHDPSSSSTGGTNPGTSSSSVGGSNPGTSSSSAGGGTSSSSSNSGNGSSSSIATTTPSSSSTTTTTPSSSSNSGGGYEMTKGTDISLPAGTVSVSVKIATSNWQHNDAYISCSVAHNVGCSLTATPACSGTKAAELSGQNYLGRESIGKPTCETFNIEINSTGSCNDLKCKIE